MNRQQAAWLETAFTFTGAEKSGPSSPSALEKKSRNGDR
jgi:hypothetical protein